MYIIIFQGVNVESLHLRADQDTMEKIMSIINKISEDGEEVEILDNLTFELEKKMILTSLKQEEANEMHEHDEVWSELLR